MMSFITKPWRRGYSLCKVGFFENMNGNLALMSSFGIQSSLLLYYARKAGL